MKARRNKGAIGALLDEYEKALEELIKLILDVSEEELKTIFDQKTRDPDCRSIQTILSHVVKAGYNYSISIRNSLGDNVELPSSTLLPTIFDYRAALKTMFHFQEKVFVDYGEIILETNDPNAKILMSWGQRYDIEQLMEHAIVHILRHRRQIEKFVEGLRE